MAKQKQKTKAIEERKALSVDGIRYTLRGRVLLADGKPAGNYTVAVYDKDVLTADDYLGTVKTSADGGFEIIFEQQDFAEKLIDKVNKTSTMFDRYPDIYFIVSKANKELLSTRVDVIKNALPSIPPITIILP